MRRATRSVTALCAVFFAAAGLAACGGIPGNAVVQVQGKSITKSTFDHWMTIAASSTATSGKKAVVPQPPSFSACIARLHETEAKPAKGQKAKTDAELKKTCEEQYEAMKKEILSYLISSSWVTGQAEEMKISVSNKEVEKKLNELKKQEYPKQAEFEKFLKTSGETVSDLLLRIKVEQFLVPKIEKKVVKQAKKPTKADIAKYYHQHESTYGTPERRNLKIILTKTEAQAKSAKGEVEGGKSFASVAKAVSIESVSKDKGGVLNEVEKGQQEKALSEAVFAAKLNTLTGPVKTPFGYYVFEVTKTLKATKQSLKAVESEIKQTLTSEGEHKVLEKFGKEYKKRWQARTECRSGYVVEYCKGYKAPKPKTTTSTTASATSTTASSTSSSASTSSTASSK